MENKPTSINDDQMSAILSTLPKEQKSDNIQQVQKSPESKKLTDQITIEQLETILSTMPTEQSSDSLKPIQNSPESKKQPNQFLENMEFLSNIEAGHIFQRAYQDAVKLAPQLADIKITAQDPSLAAPAAISPLWSEKSKSGKSEVKLRTDLSGVLKIHEKTYEPNGMRELFAKTMGVDIEKVTPGTLHIFSFVHEMGHAVDFFRYKDMYKQRAKEEWDKVTKKEMESAPIPGLRASSLLQEGNRDREHIIAKWEKVSKKTGAKNLGELFFMTAQHHRNKPTERFADEFAARVFREDPGVIVDALTLK